MLFASPTLWAWLNVLPPRVLGWSSISLVAFGSRRLSMGLIFVNILSELRASINRTQARWSLTHCLRHSRASTCWFMKRVPIMMYAARESRKTNSRWNIELPKRARMSTTPRSRKVVSSRRRVEARSRFVQGIVASRRTKRSFVSSSVQSRYRIRRRRVAGYADRFRRSRTQHSEWPSGHT